VGLLLQDPWDSVSVWPSAVAPETDGEAVLDGGNGRMTAVGDDLAGRPEPLALLAISCTMMVWPTSAAVSVYVC
jgi:hypothetical protein